MKDYSHERMLAELKTVAERARHVSLDREQLVRVAEVMRRRVGANDFHIRRDDPDLAPADLLHFSLIVGVHNFLIWKRLPAGRIEPWSVHVNGEHRYGAPAIYACHLRALRNGRNVLDPDYLARMTDADMEDYYRDERTGEVTLQFLPERRAKYNEIGRVLKEKFRGSFLTLLEDADGRLFRDDGQGIGQRLAVDFPLSYGDWPFCKLVMVTLGSLYHARDRLVPEGSPQRRLIELRDPENLEVGADYYRPFFLYRVGVLRISEDFKARLARRDLIERDGPMEQEYRAWTILATRALAEHLGLSPHVLANETWAMGFMRCRPCHIGVSEQEVPCDYRARCRGYTRETSLMDALWPLVETTNY